MRFPVCKNALKYVCSRGSALDPARGTTSKGRGGKDKDAFRKQKFTTTAHWLMYTVHVLQIKRYLAGWRRHPQQQCSHCGQSAAFHCLSLCHWLWTANTDQFDVSLTARFVCCLQETPHCKTLLYCWALAQPIGSVTLASPAMGHWGTCPPSTSS